MKKMQDILAAIPSFQGLSENQLNEIKKIVVNRHYTKGELIFSEGDHGDGFYVVAAGVIKIFKMSIEGKEILKLTKWELANLHLPPVTTVTLYEGSAPIEFLRSRIAIMLEKNPWLTSRIVKKKTADGVVTELADPIEFDVVPLHQPTLEGASPEEIIAHGENLGVISRTPHPLGDILHMSEHEAVLMTYFRNNVQHLFAIPASIACCFIHGRRLEHAELQRLIRLIYPFMKEELCLKWDNEDIDDVTTAGIDALLELEILARSKDGKLLVRPPAGSRKAYQLLMLGQSMVPMLQRFYLVISLLVKNGSGVLSRAKLERLCQQSAQRLSMIYGLHSPDFFDKALFQDFIRTLREQMALRRNNEGLLEFESLDVG